MSIAKILFSDKSCTNCLSFFDTCEKKLRQSLTLFLSGLNLRDKKLNELRTSRYVQQNRQTDVPYKLLRSGWKLKSLRRHWQNLPCRLCDRTCQRVQPLQPNDQEQLYANLPLPSVQKVRQEQLRNQCLPEFPLIQAKSIPESFQKSPDCNSFACHCHHLQPYIFPQVKPGPLKTS